MKIAIWNLQRLEKRKNNLILEKLVEIDADILILTETNTAIQVENYNCISTELLPTDFDGIKYKGGEIRVSILTKYNIAARHDTFDKFTTVCTDIETPFGLLTVYGSIIGVFGNRQPRFDRDLNGQLSDFKILFPNRQICFTGDLNTTFSGRPWPSKKVREILNDVFNSFKLTNTTANIEDTVDHIILSNDFLSNKKLSDHVGHMIMLT